MRKLVTKIEATGIGIESQKIESKIGTDSVRDFFRIQDVTHTNGDTDASNRRMRTRDGLSEVADYLSKSVFNLRDQHMEGLDLVSIHPRGYPLDEKGGFLEE